MRIACVQLQGELSVLNKLVASDAESGA
eukprot:SAG31_NODE_7774_length_1600_cov_1.063291_2_plen_27_part_01